MASGAYTASVSSVGASLRELRHRDRDLVVSFPSETIRPVYRGAILAPWPNRVVDGRWRDSTGRSHQLALTEPDRGHALHGLMAWYDYQPLEHTDTDLHLRGTVIPQQGYPYQLQVDVTYHLDDHNGLTTEVSGTNLSSKIAPWGTAPHPYLRAGDGHVDDWHLELPAQRVLEATPDRLIPTTTVPVDDAAGGSLNFTSPRLIGDTFIDHAFTGLRRERNGWARVALTAPSGRGVAMTWDHTCPWVQIHTADRPFPDQDRVGLAVEPMTCAPDAYNNGHGLVLLKPGARHTARWRITAIHT